MLHSLRLRDSQSRPRPRTGHRLIPWRLSLLIRAVQHNSRHCRIGDPGRSRSEPLMEFIDPFGKTVRSPRLVAPPGPPAAYGPDRIPSRNDGTKPEWSSTGTARRQHEIADLPRPDTPCRSWTGEAAIATTDALIDRAWALLRRTLVGAGPACQAICQLRAQQLDLRFYKFGRPTQDRRRGAAGGQGCPARDFAHLSPLRSGRAMKTIPARLWAKRVSRRHRRSRPSGPGDFCALVRSQYLGGTLVTNLRRALQTPAHRSHP